MAAPVLEPGLHSQLKYLRRHYALPVARRGPPLPSERVRELLKARMSALLSGNKEELAAVNSLLEIE